jgi:hypothetical protein
VTRRLLVVPTGSPRPPVARIHSEADDILKRIEHYASRIGEATTSGDDPGDATHAFRVFDDGTRLSIVTSLDDDATMMTITIRTAKGGRTRTVKLMLSSDGPAAAHMPRDPIGFADSAMRIARACLDTLERAPPIDGLYPFGEAMRGACHERMDAVPSPTDERPLGASVHCATPWSDASCTMAHGDGSVERTTCPALDATTMIVSARTEPGMLMLDGASMTELAGIDPITRMRLIALSRTMPTRPAADPHLPDLEPE